MEYILLIFAILLIFSIGGWIYRKKMKKTDEYINKSYCETCVRWSECNGVDDECPWLN